MLKKVIAALLVIMIVLTFTVAVSAHPPLENKPTLPAQAMMGLHRACSNLDMEGTAYHVHINWLSPHMIR